MPYVRFHRHFIGGDRLACHPRSPARIWGFQISISKKPVEIGQFVECELLLYRVLMVQAQIVTSIIRFYPRPYSQKN